MKRLHVDIETYSPEPIAEAGLYRYAIHPDFQILLVAYAMDDAPVRIIDLAQGEALPEWFVNALFDHTVTKVAHNAAFERVCFSVYLWRTGAREHGSFLPAIDWLCTAVQASRCGYPMSLAGAGAAMGFEKQKMSEGKGLIKKFCCPRPKKEGALIEDDGRNHPEDFPEDWATFKAYCIRDVEVERQIDKATSWYPVSDFEQRLYAIDQAINDRGVLLDIDLVQNAVKADTIGKARLNEEAMRLTGLSNPNSVSQLKAWLSEAIGISLDSLTKKDLPEILAATTDQRVRRVLQIRAEMGKTSNAKYQAMLDCVCPDGRVHGLLQFYGSRTGRWAGRLVQVQNLPQNHIPDLDFARTCLKEDDIETLELGYGNVADTLSQLIRTAFVAPDGKTFAVCDFSAIEARVLAWLAGEEWVLDVFRRGGDIYCATATQMFHKPVEKHGRNAELRQKGKIAVLALGYGGGVGALDAMGGKRQGMTEQEEADTVRMWRDANPMIVRFWRDVERAAKTAILECRKVTMGIRVQASAKDLADREYAAGRSVREYSVRDCKGLTFAMHDKTLYIELPSGRRICYPDTAISVNRFGNESIKYHGVDQQTNKWVWLETYGGKLTENITQAVARDCLAVVMTRLHEGHHKPVFHVHDECICEVPAGSPDDILNPYFDKPIDWAPGLPLKGAGYTTDYYKKD